MRKLDRRTVLGFGSLALAGCATEGPYFGNTQPPSRQELACAVFVGTGTINPAKTAWAKPGWYKFFPGLAAPRKHTYKTERPELRCPELVSFFRKPENHERRYLDPNWFLEPHVRGLSANIMDVHSPNYARIETSWRRQ